MSSRATVVTNPSTAYAALSPLRLSILRRLDEPATATQLADALSATRQRMNYHLRVLEGHGLIEVVEERPKRGFVERVYRRSGRLVMAPDLVERQPALTHRDQGSADAVIAAASDAIRAAGRLSTAASEAGRSLVTAALVADITFGSPSEMESFLTAFGTLVAHHDRGQDEAGQRHRITLLSHPEVSDNRSTK